MLFEKNKKRNSVQNNNFEMLFHLLQLVKRLYQAYKTGWLPERGVPRTKNDQVCGRGSKYHFFYNTLSPVLFFQLNTL